MLAFVVLVLLLSTVRVILIPQQLPTMCTPLLLSFLYVYCGGVNKSESLLFRTMVE